MVGRECVCFNFHKRESNFPKCGKRILIQALWGSYCNRQENSTEPLRKARRDPETDPKSDCDDSWRRSNLYSWDAERKKTYDLFWKYKGPGSLLMWVSWGQRIYTSEEHTLPTTEWSFWAISLTVCIIICRVHNKWRLPGLTGLILVLPAVFWLVGSQGKVILSLYLARLPHTREPLSACVQRNSTSQTSLYISCDGYL